jgi:hypothetical protein
VPTGTALKLASNPAALPTPSKPLEVAKIVTCPETPLAPNCARSAVYTKNGAFVVVVVVVVAAGRPEDRSPHDTRPPALLCTTKALPDTAVLSDVTAKTKLANPHASVLLYLILAQGSTPPNVLR